MQSDSKKPTWRERMWVAYFGVLLFWALNAYVLLGQWWGTGELFALKIDNRPYLSDFVNSYAAATMARDCLSRRVQVYDRSVQDQLQRQLVAPVVPEQTFYNQYPPVEFILFMPLALMSLPVAWIAWALVTTILSVAALFDSVLSRISGKFSKTVAATAFFASYPTWLSFRLGQPSLLLFPVMLGVWVLLKHKRFLWAGVLASILMVKLQYLPMMAAIGVALGGVQFLAGLAISCVVLLGISTLVLGWDNVASYPHALMTNEVSTNVTGVAADKMQNLRGVLTLLFGDGDIVHKVSAVVFLAAVVAMFVVWKRYTPRDSARFDLLAAVTILIMLVSSPHTHIQDYIIALLSCIWLYLFARDSGTACDARCQRWLRVGTVSFPVVSWFMFILLFLFQLVKIQPFALWAVAMAVYCSVLFFKNFDSKTAAE